MGKVKKIIASVIVVSLVTGAGAGGMMYLRKANQPEIMVAKVSGFQEDYYSDDSVSLEGYVTSDISQNVNVDKDLIVEQVYVEQGTEVNKGDKLVSFDMSLVEMELNIAKLKKQLAEVQLASTEDQYERVLNGENLSETDMNDDSSGMDDGSSSESYAPDDDAAMTIDGDPDSAVEMMRYDGNSDSLRMNYLGNVNGINLMPAYLGIPVVALSVADDGFSGESDDFTSETYGESEDELLDVYAEADEFFAEPDDEAEDFIGDGSEYDDEWIEEGDEEATDDPDPENPENSEDNEEKDPTASDEIDSDEFIYGALTEDTHPNRGTGTADDPFVFWCSISGGYRIATGGFLNKMAGYTPDGNERSEEGPYYYRLEFYNYDIIEDGLLGYFEINGADGYPKFAEQDFKEYLKSSSATTSDDGMDSDYSDDLSEGTNDDVFDADSEDLYGEASEMPQIDPKDTIDPPFNQNDSFVFRVSAAIYYYLTNDLGQGEESNSGDFGYLDDDYDFGGDSYDDSSEADFDYDAAIKSLESRMNTLKLDIRQYEIEVEKLEKKMAKQTIVSKLEGVVTSVGDAATGTNESGDAFIKVKNKSGFYVMGKVSELLREDLDEDTQLSCTSYEVGDFSATVMEVSQFPVNSSDDMSGFGTGNPNVSYYTFTASIDDTQNNMVDQDWLTITPQAKVKQGMLVLPKAFVRTKNGVSYVYKDVAGVLQKTPVKVDAIVDYGYNVLISGGLSPKDLIAFPYGKNVKDGAKTIEATADEIYEN